MIYAICKSIVNSRQNLLLRWFFGQNRQINCEGVWQGKGEREGVEGVEGDCGSGSGSELL